MLLVVQETVARAMAEFLSPKNPTMRLRQGQLYLTSQLNKDLQLSAPSGTVNTSFEMSWCVGLHCSCIA
jgi:hypothetical protein